MSGISSLTKTAEFSPLIDIYSTTQIDEKITIQESITVETVSGIAECIICQKVVSDETPVFIHRTNQNCDLYKNKQVCHICLPKLEECPVCKEILTIEEMQNSLADGLIVIQQNNQALLQEEQSFISRCIPNDIFCPILISCITAVSLGALAGGYFIARAMG